ncbi:DUF2218 domain-containing protein [Vibrio algivorus]|uniref:DUF2218 domain-containing protein n=1 Tax=Vibrio algivorus TaxID=1667024 RepID=A0ABQ6EMJ9_9VIBR|nr:DUF2218 domain-containing protein [Vibrio algivorus]GLT14075.1 hypothetical protein GCM10007931_10490 [Vibrio algivorus]
MMKLWANVETVKAEKYQTVMARHFQRKVEVVWNENEACVYFPTGIGYLTVTDNLLQIRCESETEEKLKIVQSVLESHFHQFTHRENLALEWHTLK